MFVKDIISFFEEIAPFSYQESYDNSGLQIGSPDKKIQGILITLDVTEEIIDEAIKRKTDLIISHHPVIFGGIKKITGSNMAERVIMKAIKNDIAILSVHTNIDAVFHGVNSMICDKLVLKNRSVLEPAQEKLLKLVFFVPEADADRVRQAVFQAGAGVIGEYDQCSYNLNGKGSFRASENTNPYAGDKHKLHFEPETRIETILPVNLKHKVISALISSHPYEEVAYDIYPLKNEYDMAGMGMIGEFEEEMEEYEFLNSLKSVFNAGCIRYTRLLNKAVKKVAVCGGSGSFLLKNAIRKGADAFISGDFKYHQFFESENEILIADIGHYESEQFTKELFYEVLTKKFPKFAVYLSEVNTNPINYL